MEQQIKYMRVRIDALSKLVKELGNVELTGTNGPFTQSILNHELQHAYDDLILAKAWLGKVLECLGTDSPYKNDGKRKTAADIEPTADVAQFRPEVDTDWVGLPTAWWQDATHIEKIDWIRQRIKEFIDPAQLPSIDMDHPDLNSIISCLNHHSRHINEARFWLGFELQRIRESNS